MYFMRTVVMGRLLAVGASMALLAGCSGGLAGLGGKQAKAYVGWYCVDNVETGIKDCEKRLLRNGVPVNDKVYESLGAKAEPPGGEQSGQGRGESPLTVINPLDDGGGLSVENQGPPPRQVRSYVDRSGEARDSAESGEL
jgi:hypothetical protein